MKFEEKHLVHLAAVIEYGGVTAAAEELGLSQPAVSRTLSALEKRVGEPLFQPGRRPLAPTLIGSELARHGRVILQASREATEAMSSFRAGSAGTVRIAGVPFFMDAFISGMIGGFQRIAPDILVEQGYGNLKDLETSIAAKRLDLAICPLGAMKSKPEFRFTPILKARNVVACRVGHPLLRRKTLNRTDVADYPWIAPLPGSPLLADLHTILLNLDLPEVCIRYSGGSLLSVLNYLEETDALTILPHSVCFAHRKDRQVTVLPLDIPQPPRSLGILRAREARLPAAEQLANHILKEFDALRAAIERHQTSIVWGP
ncbi:DNA-binding transcriptional regulator, LysR family [Palleronia salina]|uniref:DNA-binding transcriptional regulator, LysR family n=1 Tax=Palleronia salina TaxID=313368 RepID=A0A1M6M1B3_9RHOB|nr:LysR family transcriptional regulator [Palleronia salina]SHJ77267.1 DNA-binding transcriptional regulator, LysR family [Palleronia salina]